MAWVVNNNYLVVNDNSLSYIVNKKWFSIVQICKDFNIIWCVYLSLYLTVFNGIGFNTDFTENLAPINGYSI